MTLKPSAYRNYSITVNLHNPLIMGGASIRSIEKELNSYSHTISAAGGFTSASITINISPDEIDDWITYGLGRHIVSYGSGGEVVWEGFVDNISINLGNDTIERGRLTEICNRCMATYTPVTTDPDTADPVSGTTTSTVVADDILSIKKYGIWEQIISGGSIAGVGDNVEEELLDILAKADYMRDLYLSEYKNPETSHNPIIGIDSGGSITLTLDCKGYIEWLKYVYNYTPENVLQESIEIYNKIIAVIDEDPNNIISRLQSFISYNPLLINAIEDKDRDALTIINEAVSIGDINNNRWIFGIYEDRVPYYNKISSSIDYLYYTSSKIQKIVSLDNSEVLPWNVRPGKLLFLADAIVGDIPDLSDPRSDPRTMLIEEINYTAPDTVNISGKKIKNFEQLQASQGLA